MDDGARPRPRRARDSAYGPVCAGSGLRAGRIDSTPTSVPIFPRRRRRGEGGGSPCLPPIGELSHMGGAQSYQTEGPGRTLLPSGQGNHAFPDPGSEHFALMTAGLGEQGCLAVSFDSANPFSKNGPGWGRFRAGAFPAPQTSVQTVAAARSSAPGTHPPRARSASEALCIQTGQAPAL